MSISLKTLDRSKLLRYAGIALFAVVAFWCLRTPQTPTAVNEPTQANPYFIGPYRGSRPLGPAKVFKAEDWYAYLRENPHTPPEFFHITPDANGTVQLRAEDWVVLQHTTGGLPNDHAPGYLDKDGVYWKFDYRRNEYLRQQKPQ